MRGTKAITSVSLAAAALLAGVLAGCVHRSESAAQGGWATSKSGPVRVAPAPPAAEARAAALLDTRSTPLETLTPVASGAGIVIAEPVPAGADAFLAAFGGGCALWLYFTLGGRGECGRMPRWSEIPHAVRELGRGDLRVSAEQAKPLARILGATHAAVGEVSGNGGRCTLTYHVVTIPDLQPVGAPVVAAGTPAEVTASLPGMATEIAGRLGVPAPRGSGPPAETPQDLVLLGQLRWTAPRPPAMRAAQLKKAAGHSPVAALAYLADRVRAGDWAAVSHDFTETAQRTENPLVLSALAGSASHSTDLTLYDVRSKRMPELLARFPNNYALRAAESLFALTEDQYPDARRAAQQAVRCADRDPEAWRLLGDVLRAQADRIRRARALNDMTEAEVRNSRVLFAQAVAVRKRVVALDPESEDGWHRVSTEAAFAEDPELSDQAFWKAVSLGGDPTLYVWGLELYQPKWLDDAKKRDRVAHLAARARYETAADRLYMAKMLYEEGYPSLGRGMPLAPAERAELKSWVARHHPELAERS